jgi:hypothetical protein
MQFYVSAGTCGSPPALAASTIESVTVWVRAGAALAVAALAGALSGCLLTVTAPAGVTRPWPGPVLETVTPAQLAAMSMRLDATVQPVELPSWLEVAGLRLPTTILLAGDAESTVRQNSGAVRDVMERVLTRATVTARSSRPRGPTIVRRLVWAIVGTRASSGSVGGLIQVIWLVDAHNGRELVELNVPAPAIVPAGP